MAASSARAGAHFFHGHGIIADVLSQEKSPEPIGTSEEPIVAFQLFLGVRPVLFGSFGFHAIPLVGTYDHDDYSPALPIALVSVPVVAARLAEQLPASVAEMVSFCVQGGLVDPDGVDLFLEIHSQLEGPAKGIECGHLACRNTNEFNLIYHSWLFQDDGVADGAGEITAKVHMYVFLSRVVDLGSVSISASLWKRPRPRKTAAQCCRAVLPRSAAAQC